MQPGAGNRLPSGRRQEHRGQRFFGRREILALFGDYKPLTGDVPTNYYMPLGWLRPSCGPWQLRGVDVIELRHVPPKRKGNSWAAASFRRTRRTITRCGRKLRHRPQAVEGVVGGAGVHQGSCNRVCARPRYLNRMGRPEPSKSTSTQHLRLAQILQ
jgi:hypothetical protein